MLSFDERDQDSEDKSCLAQDPITVPSMYWGPHRHHRREGQLELTELWPVKVGGGLLVYVYHAYLRYRSR